MINHTGRSRVRIGILVAVALLGVYANTQAGSDETAHLNSVGVILPQDAAPPGEQVLRLMGTEHMHLDVAGNLYQASTESGAAWLWERLVMLDEHMQLVPGVAESWEMSADGLSWTFHLREDAMWSDGSALTAHDFEYALKRQLDPATGSGWAWFYYDIKNAAAVNNGELESSLLGVEALDDYTLIIHTELPTLYLPMLMSVPSSAPVPRAVVEEYGFRWTTSPETCLTNSAFKLEEWEKGRRIVLTLNENYRGSHNALLERIEIYFGDPEFMFSAYQAGEIDGLHADVEYTFLTAADVAMIRRDSVLSNELYTFPYPGTWYIFFDTLNAPFDNTYVRKAISHAIDRETILAVALKGLGVPAYGMLPPGIQAYQGEQLESIQDYDPALARELMEQAGYPEGAGFPSVELWLREPDSQTLLAAQMVQQMLKDNCGISVEVRPTESRLYNDELARNGIPMSLISWYYDYLDPSNFLNIGWHSQQSRHSWTNPEFDQLVDQAIAEANWSTRVLLYNQAEAILCEDVGAVFLWHPMHCQMWKPYVKGIDVDQNGYEWVSYWDLGMHHLYIADR